MALAALPLSDVQFASVVEACSLAVPEVVFPLALILVVSALFLVGAEEHSVAVPLILTVPVVSENRALIFVSVCVSKLVDPMRSVAA